MSSCDPMRYASQASNMSDREIFDQIHASRSGDDMNDFKTAILDEARLRGMLSASEVDAIIAAGRSVA